jgi:hypothetical protein
MLKRVTTESVGNDSGVSLNPREHHGKWSDECIAKTNGRSANEDNSVTEHRLRKTIVQYINKGIGREGPSRAIIVDQQLHGLIGRHEDSAKFYAYTKTHLDLLNC